ncbi:reverse transcriptase domain-containing protein [Tanacetum coccineum]|uniref:Reverse transcriptase domain-containing protein n=1 Tax=Tanacetum coccineum TaxID=301880 RepID=A0ABQ5EJI6_9ASTR
MLKLPLEGRVITLKSSRMVPLECAMVSGLEGDLSVTKQMVEERIKVAINPEYPEQTIMIGSTLTEEGRNKHIAEHRLNVREGCSPVRQKRRGQVTDRNQAIQEEVGKLVEAGIMKEVHYHDWLSNPVMVKKHDDNAYKGYHQIQMAKEDEEKIAFITSQGIFCYTKMPFGLRNARATYQRLVDKAFHKQIGRNLEVYVDDLVIKSRMKDEIVRDIEETFKTLREINMKLNPKKCTFGVEEGMFLGCKVNTRGLKVCPDKVDAVLSLPSPKCLKDVQKLNGKLASLNRFLAKSAEKSLPFFKSDFHWTAKAEEAFKQMKQLIAELPIPRVSVKGKILTDFIVERPEEDSPDTLMEVEEELPEPWILFTDGSSCTDGSGAGLILTNPEGMEFTYALRFRILTSSFKEFSIRQVPRSENKKADALSKIASTSFAHLSKQVLVEELKEKSISEVEILAVVEEEGDTWMTPIFEYLTEETLPADVKKARAQKLTPIVSPWPFYKWGIDIVGPFPEGPGKVKFLIVAIDYFTKWIEAKPVATIIGNQIKKFMWDNIVCRFGLPGEIISDNGKQFQDNPFKEWCGKLCIPQHFASVKHPQTNGLVERANRNLGEGIKARLDAKNKNWLEDLSHVLWARRTMIKSSNGDTPFSLTYGTEVVISAKIGMPTLRTTKVDLAQNNEALEINIDLLEEKREQAAIHEAKSKAKMEKYYNSKVRSISFKPGDLVYRNNDASRAEDTGKLGPKWEGPYEITKALGKGAYKLRDRDGKQLPRTWNVSNLKRCYIHKM